MSELLQEALDGALGAGAAYADVRLQQRVEERVWARKQQVADVGSAESVGLAVRVLHRGAWGFAATAERSASAARNAAALAVANAAAAAETQRQKVQLADEPPHRGRFETPYVVDPATIPLEQKIALLVEATRQLEAEPTVAFADAGMMFRTDAVTFRSSAGADIQQVIRQAGVGMSATSTGPGGIQRRSYPNSGFDWIGGGYEVVQEADLLDHTEEVASEAAALQTAPPCPAGEHNVILDPRQLSLQIHESVGHPLELDRVLGGEADFAGTSFATPDHLGERLYGSPLVHLTADATLERGLGTFGYDHEGVEAQKWALIEEGVLRGYLTSRESAGALGESRSKGTMRADGWRRVPIVRMVNISLEPGPEPLSLAELIADTGDGIYMSTNRSWSIDQRRLNFQFGCEIAWEIKGGKLGRMLRNPTYWDITPRFWGSCDAICGPETWEVWGVYNCGKGQPMQTCQMSHGSSPARFRNVPCGGGM